MKHVDVAAIRQDPEQRFAFLADFVGFEARDWEALRESVPVLASRLPQLLDRLYAHLLSFDDARSAFLGASGELDPAYVTLRQEHLTEWFLETTGSSGDWQRFPHYLAGVARAHTARGGDPRRRVPPRYMVGLVGFLQAALVDLCFECLPSETARARRYATAWTRMLAIQLELFLKEMAPSWPAWDEPGADS